MKTSMVLASVALVGLLGCTDNQTADNSRTSGQGQGSSSTTQTTTTTTESSAMSASDQELAKRVEETIKQNPALATAAQNIQVQAKNGEITLRGSVNNEQEKANIAAEAQKVAGVSKVDNLIQVASASS